MWDVFRINWHSFTLDVMDQLYLFHMQAPPPPREGGGALELFFDRVRVPNDERNPEMGFLRADYKHKI